MISHAALARLAAAAYSGPQSGRVALDVRYDLIPRDGELVVVMPGTHPADPLDWLRDLRAWPRWFAGVGPAHSGFGGGGAALWRRIGPELARETRLITYAGHSLGGALAQMLAVFHAAAGLAPCRAVTFGAPRVPFVNPWFRVLARRALAIAEYARAGDIVPDAPLRALYHHPSRPVAIGASVGNIVGDHSIARYAADLQQLGL